MKEHTVLPVGLGAVMGAMMIWMLHRQIVSATAPDLTGLLIFVGGHIAVLAVLFILPVVAAPRLRRWAERLHRPDLRHVGLMLAGAASGAVVFHLSAHGIWH